VQDYDGKIVVDRLYADDDAAQVASPASE